MSKNKAPYLNLNSFQRRDLRSYSILWIQLFLEKQQALEKREKLLDQLLLTGLKIKELTDEMIRIDGLRQMNFEEIAEISKENDSNQD